ncbi:MAG: Trk family potassium uptake protein [Chloroflexi bacterium]|nr:Trk family potassium uptake protein [Chloroflexota bacterium]
MEPQPFDNQETELAPARVTRTPRIFRPFDRVVRLRTALPGPPRAIGAGGVVIGFLALIAVGTALLSLPEARRPGADGSFITALFTATSAVCVTGLVVVDTADYWSPLGQGIILALIQAGGLGIMTASMLILIVFRRPISLRDRLQLQETSRFAGIRNVVDLVVLTVVTTLFLESVGALLLTWRLYDAGHSSPVWNGIFLSVSAFNNAGFDISGGYQSLVPFVTDPVLLGIMGTLIVLGGLGVLVILDCLPKGSRWHTSINTKMVLTATPVLLAIGFVAILVMEFNNPQTLGERDLGQKLWNALFHSITARTAGFATLPVDKFSDATLFINEALMFIGGASGSTAGGTKLSTTVLLLLATWSGVQGYEGVSGYGRRFSNQLVYRALAILFLAFLVIFTAALVLLLTEGFPFPRTLFEVVSAFGTVGLSTGITPELSMLGKLVIVVVMFIGRLGPLTLAYRMAQRAREPNYRYPETDIPLG